MSDADLVARLRHTACFGRGTCIEGLLKKDAIGAADRIAALKDRAKALENALRVFLRWAEQHDVKFPPEILANARAALEL